MEFAFEVTGAKRPPIDAPAQQPMRPTKLVRNPDTDQKKVRRQQARQQKKAAMASKTAGTLDENLDFFQCPQCGASGDDLLLKDPWTEHSDLAVADELPWVECSKCGWVGSDEDLIDTGQRHASKTAAWENPPEWYRRSDADKAKVYRNEWGGVIPSDEILGWYVGPSHGTCRHCGQPIEADMAGNWGHDEGNPWCDSTDPDTEAEPIISEGSRTAKSPAVPEFLSCPACGGAGMTGGSQTFFGDDNFFATDHPCPSCGGTGRIPDNRGYTDDDPDDPYADSYVSEAKMTRRTANQGMNGDYTWGDIARYEYGDDPEDMWFSCDACGADGPTSKHDGPCPKCGSDRVEYLNPEDEEMDSRQRLQDEMDVFGDPSYEASRREANILKAMAKASLPEQRALAIELDTIRREARQSAQAARELDLADSHIRDCLTPVFTHTFHSAATDWIDEVPDVDGAGEDDTVMAHAMRTEAALWFRKTSAEVKADRDEFAEQAMGMARVHAGRYGERAHVARQAFLDAVAHMHRVAESGSELKADPSGQGQSKLPHEVPLAGHERTFDEDFWSDLGAEVSSDRAPVVQENKQGRLAGLTCPECGDSNYTNRGDGSKRCDSCGHEWDPGPEDERKESSRRTAGEVPPEFKEHQKSKGDGEGDDGDDKPDWLKEKIEGRRHYAGEGENPFAKKDESEGESESKPEEKSEETSEAPAAGGDEGEGLTDEEKAELEQLRQEQNGGAPAPAAGESAPPAEGESKPEEKKEEDKGENPFAKKDAALQKQSIFCGKCKGQGMIRAGGVVKNCTTCKGTGLKPGPRKKVQDVFGKDYQAALLVQAEVEGWPIDTNVQEKDDVDEWPGDQESTGWTPDIAALPGVESAGRSDYANPGSSLRTPTRNNPRSYPCPTCKQPNKLTPADKKRGYQCDDCADREEGVGYYGRRHHASEPIADESGQGQSSLEDVKVGEEDDKPMWPWELPEGDPDRAADAADVADVPTPGGESGYPQPKKSQRRQAGVTEREICAVCDDEIEKDENGGWKHKSGDKDHAVYQLTEMTFKNPRYTSSRTATRYCKTHEVYIGEGNAANHDEACSIEERETKDSRRRVAAEGEGGSTCSTCGDSIARDPEGEDPRTWHHTNGTSHDHEASPSGGESKESKMAAFRRTVQTNLQRI